MGKCLGHVRLGNEYKKYQWNLLCSNLSTDRQIRIKATMATFSTPISFPFRCSSSSSSNGNAGNNHNHREHRSVDIKIINGSASCTTPIKLDSFNEIARVVRASTSLVTTNDHENGYVSEEQIRQNIPTKKQLVDPYRQGLIIERGVGYRQTVVVRSYEVGPDKTATLESLLNLFQVIIYI